MTTRSWVKQYSLVKKKKNLTPGMIRVNFSEFLSSSRRKVFQRRLVTDIIRRSSLKAIPKSQILVSKLKSWFWFDLKQALIQAQMLNKGIQQKLNSKCLNLKFKQGGRRRERRKKVEIPIFFSVLGWRPYLAFKKISQNPLYPFKKYWQEAVALIFSLP
jgi:hypothetical protein